MSELVRFELEDGGGVLVEVDEDAYGVARAARDQDEVIKAGKKLQAALAVIRPAAHAIAETFSGLTPDEKQVHFGVKLNGQAGAFIAKTGAEGHFHVTLLWKTKPDGEGI